LDEGPQARGLEDLITHRTDNPARLQRVAPQAVSVLQHQQLFLVEVVQANRVARA
jgi:hypothetical protein